METRLLYTLWEKKKQPPERSVTPMFEIQSTYKCDVFCFYQFCAERKVRGVEEGRTNHVVHQLLREEIRKLNTLVKEARCLAESRFWYHGEINPGVLFITPADLLGNLPSLRNRKTRRDVRRWQNRLKQVVKQHLVVSFLREKLLVIFGGK